MEEKKRQLLEVSARLNTIRCNIEAIKERQRRQKRHRHSKQLAVAKMLLSWEGGKLAKAQSFLRQRLRSEPNAAEKHLAERGERWRESCDATRRSAGEPAFVRNGDRVEQEANNFLSEAALHSWVEDMNLKGDDSV